MQGDERKGMLGLRGKQTRKNTTVAEMGLQALFYTSLIEQLLIEN